MMTNENDTDPLNAPPPRDETDPNYPGRPGERVSYGSVSRPGIEPNVRTDPNFLTALKETEAQGVPHAHAVPLPPVAIAEAPKAPPGKNDSIDELIDGLPLDAPMPKKSGSSALPKAAVPSAPLPPVMVDVKTEPPAHRKKGRVDNSTVVTPAGLELKTQRWMTAGVAVAIGLAVLVWMINWSAGPSRKVEEPEITTTERQHPVTPPPPMLTNVPPPVAAPVVVEHAPSESATVMH
ncbi:MAG: hypothetical protein ABIP39_09680, partial [Polyangiaceae bacterium]